jgi:hypothetical protein
MVRGKRDDTRPTIANDPMEKRFKGPLVSPGTQALLIGPLEYHTAVSTRYYEFDSVGWREIDVAKFTLILKSVFSVFYLSRSNIARIEASIRG